MIFLAVAFACAPTFWWLSILAGAAAGYFSYDLREIWQAIPLAMQRAGIKWQHVLQKVRHALQEVRHTLQETKKWLTEPHPFFYGGLLVAVPFTWPVAYILQQDDTVPWALTLVLEVLAFSTFTTVLIIALGVLEEVGLKGKGKHILFDHSVKRGYAEVARNVGKGLLVVTPLILKGVIYKPIQFLVHLFRIIHSQKRILCAVDGTLGGILICLWLASPSNTLFEKALLLVFGGLLGAVLGVANWEIVSKRILHVDVPINGT